MSAATPELFGRSAEFEQLRRFLDDGAHPVLVLRGNAGVGKTALVGGLSAVAADSGWQVLSLTGVEFEAQFAMAGLSQLVLPFRALVSELSADGQKALAPTLGGDSYGNPSPLPLALALLDLLSLAAQHAPLLVVVDDAHWLDDISAKTITLAGQRLQDPRVRILAVCRSEVHSVIGDGPWPWQGLSPFDADTAAAYLGAATEHLPAHLRAAVLAAAEGNPLALNELPQSFATAQGWDGDREIALSDRLQSVFGARLRHLDPEARAQLLRGALDGSGVGARAAQAPGSRYHMHGVEAAVEHGLLTVDRRGEFVFRHPLVRAAVIQSATANERRAAHAELADIYPDDVIRRAAHLSACTVDPDQCVADVLEQAARATIGLGGAGQAVDLLRRAADLSKRPGRRAELSAEAAFVAAQSARLDAAAALVDHAPAEAISTDAEVRAAAALTQAYLAMYRDGDVISSHHRVTAALHGAAELDDDTVTRLVNVLLAITQYYADPASWAITDSVIDSVADRVAPNTLIYRDAWGDVGYRGHRVGSALRAQLLYVDDMKPWDLMRLGVAAHYTDHLEQFRVALHRHVEREAADGAVTNAMTMMQLVLLDQIASGQWAQAEETAARGVELTDRHDYEMFGHQFRAFWGLLVASRGDTARARAMAVDVEAFARPRRLGLHLGYVRQIGILCAMADADYEAAFAAATSIATPGQIPHYSHPALATILDLVESAVRTDRHDAARAHVQAAHELRLGDISPRLGLVVAAATAIAAPDDDAEPLYAQAINHSAAQSFPFDHARAQLAHGMWLRRQRQYRNAQIALAAAASTFETLGAAPWAARANAELRAAGSTPHRPHGGAAPLSAQERRIAELAAAGLSNKQIGEQLYLSPRTVGAHLYRVFPKLGITRRAALREALDGLDAADARAGDLTST